MHFRGTFHQWKYKEPRKVRLQSEKKKKKTKKWKREESSTFVNFHPVEFYINHDLDVAADSIELQRAESDASSSYPVLFFSLFFLICFVKADTCISRMASNLFFLLLLCAGLE